MKNKLNPFIIGFLVFLALINIISCNKHSNSDVEQGHRYDFFNELPKHNKRMIEGIEKYPYQICFFDWETKDIMKERNWREIIDKCNMIDYWAEAMDKSRNVDEVNYLISFLADLRRLYVLKKRRKITNIIKQQLNHKCIDVRIYAADTLYKMGYRKGPYKVYVDIVTMDESKLKDIIENRHLKDDYIMKQFDDIDIEQLRIRPLIHSLNVLMKNYNNKKTKKIIKKVLKKPYINKLIFRYDKAREIYLETHGIKNYNKFSKIIEEYIEK